MVSWLFLRKVSFPEGPEKWWAKMDHWNREIHHFNQIQGESSQGKFATVYSLSKFLTPFNNFFPEEIGKENYCQWLAICIPLRLKFHISFVAFYFCILIIFNVSMTSGFKWVANTLMYGMFFQQNSSLCKDSSSDTLSDPLPPNLRLFNVVSKISELFMPWS